jgi:hypothetical protein
MRSVLGSETDEIWVGRFSIQASLRNALYGKAFAQMSSSFGNSFAEING